MNSAPNLLLRLGTATNMLTVSRANKMRAALFICLVSFTGCSHDAVSSKTSLDSNNHNVKTMDWILVKHGTPERIKAAVISHAQFTAPVNARTFTVRITPLASKGHAVTFDDKAPPYAFANLIGWLNEPPEFDNVSDAVGWYSSQSSRVRYFLRPDDTNPAGSTLVGAPKSGNAISVYLPELSVCELSTQIKYLSDTELVPHNIAPALTFDVVLDVNESFGNLHFELTHEMDTRW